MNKNEHNLTDEIDQGREDVDIKNVEVEFDDKTPQDVFVTSYKNKTKVQVKESSADFFDIDLIQAKLQEQMEKVNISYVPESSNSLVEVDSGEIEPIEDASSVDDEIEYISPTGTQIITTDGTELEEVVSSEEVISEEGEVDNDISKLPDVIESSSVINDVEAKVKLQDGEKKYIVYVEADNIRFMNHLSLKDRNVLINQFLREQNATIKKRRMIKDLTKFTNQVIIMVFTVIIALPLFFLLLNKSIEVTILNYQQAQQNFVKLYREQGKIKNYKSFQKHFL